MACPPLFRPGKDVKEFNCVQNLLGHAVCLFAILCATVCLGAMLVTLWIFTETNTGKMIGQNYAHIAMGVAMVLAAINMMMIVAIGSKSRHVSPQLWLPKVGH